MLARHMYMRSADRTLHQRPEAFKAVDVVLTAHPFVFRMIDRAVVIAMPRKLGIGFQFVGADSRTPFHVRENVWLQCRAPHVFDNPSYHVASAFQHSEHNGFAGSTTPALASTALAADHCFVCLDVSRKRRIAVNEAEILAKLMPHAPCRLVVHAKLALQFLRGDTVPRCSEKVHRVEPFLQRRM